MAKLATYMNADPVGFRIDLLYGNIGAIANGVSLGKAPTGIENWTGGAFYVEQAFATLKSGMLTLDVGRFVTNASDEVIETKANWNYSRSFLFTGVPFIHTGARLGIAVNEMLSLQVDLLNGWNNDPDNNTNKTFGGQVAVTLPSKTTIFANTYIGNENTGGEPKDVQMLYDLVVGQTVNDMVALSFNGDFWKRGDAQWWGIGIKGKLSLNDNFYLVPRFEYLNSKKGGFGIDSGFAALTDTSKDHSLIEGTLTVGIPVKKNYEVRVEFRGDHSDIAAFQKKGAALPPALPPTDAFDKSQFTALIGFLAWLP
jgi:hypothetical protein